MAVNFDSKKVETAKKILALDLKRRVYNSVFGLFKNEINEMIDLGLSYKTILKLLNKELDYDLNYKTFFAWLNKNIKQNQNSNINTSQLKNKINEVKKEEIKNNNKEDDPWWEKQIREATEGMKKANLRV